MITLLINTLDIASIPFFLNNNHSIYNPNSVEAFIIKEALINKYTV